MSRPQQERKKCLCMTFVYQLIENWNSTYHLSITRTVVDTNAVNRVWTEQTLRLSGYKKSRQ